MPPSAGKTHFKKKKKKMVELNSYLKPVQVSQTSTKSPVLVQSTTSLGLAFVCMCACDCPVRDIFNSTVY